MAGTVTLLWRCFTSLTDARREFGHSSCVYAQADASGHPVRVGKATKGLHARYRGGTGWALDAAMHQSGNLVFVAAVPPELCAQFEAALIWEWRAKLPYNQVGKLRSPPVDVPIL